MADSFSKKEREKKRQKRKKDKAELKAQRKLEGSQSEEFMYLDEDGNLTTEKPDPNKKKPVYKLEDIDVSTPKKEDMPEEDKTRTGIVKFFNHDKGYGFIADKQSGDSLFVHIENITGDIREHDRVTFEIGSGPKGPVALSVKIV